MEKEFLVILYNFTIDFAIKLIKLKINVEFSDKDDELNHF